MSATSSPVAGPQHFVDIAQTPDPPYYSVTTTATVADDLTGYGPAALSIIDGAAEIDGFLGIESAIGGQLGIAVSYWSSLEAIDEWRRSPAHIAAKAEGQTRWFTSYITRIALVEHAY